MNETVTTLDEICSHLRSHRGRFITGPALAERFGLSRTAVWKHIQSLRDLGYRIEAHPKKGYRLLEIQDLLLPEEITENLLTSWLGTNYCYYPELGSTNDEAMRLAAAGAPHGTVVATRKQTAGRGRLDRRWLAPPDRDLTFTCILRPPLPPAQATQFTLAAALAVASVLRSRFDLPAVIKWPNDILIEKKKVTGILTEMQCDHDRIGFLVVGIGINVNQNEKDLEKPFRFSATSLRLQMDRKIDRVALLKDLLRELERQFDLTSQGRFSSMIAEIESYSMVIGRVVTLDVMGEIIRGRVQGLSPEGALRLQCESGPEKTIWAGDVTQVRDFS